MNFKKVFSVMALSLVVAILAFSGIATAQPMFDLGAREQLGNIVLFGYYDVRSTTEGGPGLSDNYFSVVNTSDSFVNVHVRVRTGKCSVELLDFDAILTPHDVFAFDISPSASGAVFASCDTDTLIASGFNGDIVNGCVSYPANTSLISSCGACPTGAALTPEEAVSATKWGYVEVIGELQFNSTRASTEKTCTAQMVEDGDYYLYKWLTTDDCCSLSGVTCDVVDNVLFGRVYQARFNASVTLVELSTENGLSMDSPIDKIINHRRCYDTAPELGCSSADSELRNITGDGYAYDVASDAPLGAQDINQCFFKNVVGPIGSTKAVENRIGAAATFGPTLADIDLGPGRSSDWEDTALTVAQLNNGFAKQTAVSHYFRLPGIGETKYIFTFPLQHFINQTIGISRTLRYDTAETLCKGSSKKFISPGIPAPEFLAGEVTILGTQLSTDPCTDVQGWVEWTMAASDAICADAFNVSTGLGLWDCDYSPAVIGTVGNSAAPDATATAPMQWKDSRTFITTNPLP